MKSKVLVVDNDLIENLNELKTFVKNAHKKEIKIVIAVRAVQNITEVCFNYNHYILYTF